MGQLTETIEIEINRKCIENPVYIQWLNSLGGWSYWLFGGTQAIEQIISNKDEFVVYNEELETADTIRQVTGKTSRRRMTLGAEGLTKNQVEAISELLDSPQVYIVVSETERIVVIPDEGTFGLFETRPTLSDIEFDIFLPDKYTQNR